MNKSENINELAAALSRAQGAIKGALKDSLNPHFKAKYADLASTWDACREQLAKNELSVVQMPDVSDTGGIAVETILMHSSGQWISSRFVMPVPKPDAHGVGSAITYARRYALAAMVGIAPEDDDGNKAIETDKEDKKREKVGTEALIAMKDDIPFYPEETARLKACGSINQLSLVYHKLDPSIRFALVAVKDQCKADIIKAEMGATV